MKPVIFLVSFFLLFICLACAQIVSNTENKAYLKENTQTTLSEKKTEDCVTMKFRYLITQDYKSTPNTRHIEVFLDEKAFTEKNLKTLFNYLSDKNPEPNNSPNRNNLIVIVNTDWRQLEFPTDCPPIGISETGAGTDTYHYHFARFYRRGENAFFTYNPTLKTDNLKDVIMKGNKIFRNGQWQEP